MNPFLREANQALAYDQVEAAHIGEATVWIMDACRRMKADLAASPDDDKTSRLWQRDDLFDALMRVLQPIYLLNETHPRAEVRDAAQKGVETLLNFESELYLDEDLYQAFAAFARTVGVGLTETEVPAHLSPPRLDPVERRYVKRVMDYYQRNGFRLGPDQRKELKALDEILNQKEIQFQKNISNCDDYLVLSEEEMEGLSQTFKDAHREPDGRYRVTVSPPDYLSVLKFAKDETVRKRLFYLYHNRAKDLNLPLLDELLTLRQKRASLLGYENHAMFTLDDVMAGDPDTVWRFLEELASKAASKANHDYRQLCEVMETDSLLPWNRLFATNLHKERHFRLDEEQVKPYFSLDKVILGLFDLAQTLYGIRLQESPDLAVWHSDVRGFTVYDGDQTVARFYLDLFPRSHKYSHAACFGLQCGKRIPGGYRVPEAALVCNFTKPGGGKPSLLTHHEVETLFHEFGHLMHHLLTRSPLAYFSGTNVIRDFVEMPSQIMENWVWEPEALKRFAVHYQTGKVIPDELLERMLAVRHHNSGIDLQQQILYASLDMTYHQGFQPKTSKDTTLTMIKLYRKHTLFPYAEGTHFQASFSHLVGYAAGYYGYLWSRVFADDMYSVFKERGIFNREVGTRFREIILAKGDTEPPMNLIQAFLGREPRMDAFLENLGIRTLDPA